MSQVSCMTTQFGNTYCPQLKLIIADGTNTDTYTNFAWELQYVAHGLAFSASAKPVTAVIDGQTVYSGNYAISGKTGTYKIAGGNKQITKGTSGRKFSFSCSINFGSASWNGTTGGNRSASGTAYIGAKTSYTITYNANGGSGAPGKQTKWYGTNITLSSSKPTRTGYTFAGWATSSGGSVAYQPGATYSANASVTLYAKWTAITYTVSYNANGGSGAPSSQTKTYGVTLTLSNTKPSRTNYNFKGWATSAGGLVAYSAGASYTKNASVTLYAIWELAYTKPRITNLKADRCNSSGTLDDDGTYAKVTFNWATDRTVSSIKVAGVAISASSTSGSVSKVVGGSYSTETTYNISVSVADSGGTTTTTVALPPMTFVIDCLKGGTGVAFGKPSTTANLVDSKWNIKAPTFTGNTSGTHTGSVIFKTESDTRDDATSPDDYQASMRFRGLKNNTVIGSPYSGTYSYILGLRGWSDHSGGAAHELAFHNGGISHRIATSDTAWGTWSKLVRDSDLKSTVLANSSNYTSQITVGNLRGGSLSNFRMVRYEKVITIYFQINNITSGGSDVTIFTLKNSAYRPVEYGVHNAFISKPDNVCYIGQFSDGHFTMAISGSGAINSGSTAMVLCTLTYITA